MKKIKYIILCSSILLIFTSCSTSTTPIPTSINPIATSTNFSPQNNVGVTPSTISTRRPTGYDDKYNLYFFEFWSAIPIRYSAGRNVILIGGKELINSRSSADAERAVINIQELHIIGVTKQVLDTINEGEDIFFQTGSPIMYFGKFSKNKFVYHEVLSKKWVDIVDKLKLNYDRIRDHATRAASTPTSDPTAVPYVFSSFETIIQKASASASDKFWLDGQHLKVETAQELFDLDAQVFEASGVLLKNMDQLVPYVLTVDPARELMNSYYKLTYVVLRDATTTGMSASTFNSYQDQLEKIEGSNMSPEEAIKAYRNVYISVIKH